MNAILAAREVYERFGSLRPFEEDLRRHLLHGVVIASPEAFAMGRPVRRDAPEVELACVARTFEEPDCWLIWSAAGDLRKLVGMLPYRLPWMAFHRQHVAGPVRLRIYSTERLIKLAISGSSRERRKCNRINAHPN